MTRAVYTAAALGWWARPSDAVLTAGTALRPDSHHGNRILLPRSSLITRDANEWNGGLSREFLFLRKAKWNVRTALSKVSHRQQGRWHESRARRYGLAGQVRTRPPAPESGSGSILKTQALKSQAVAVFMRELEHRTLITGHALGGKALARY